MDMATYEWASIINRVLWIASYMGFSFTIQTANLASEKNNFRTFWIDMQRGYFSLLLKDYSPRVYTDQKYVYSSWVKLLSSQEEVTDHLKFAFNQVGIIISYSATTYITMCKFRYTFLAIMTHIAIQYTQII